MISPTTTSPIVKVDDLRVDFDLRSINGRRLGTVKAIDGVSLEVRPGEILGLVGESGCGKSTLGRAIVELNTPSAGTISVTSARTGEQLAPKSMQRRRAVQIVFQDPYSALNPRRRIGAILNEARVIQGFRNHDENHDRIRQLMADMGFGPEALQRYPHQFSGGQLQRIGIARAIVNDPELVICDEPVSALDVSIQSQILNLLADLQRDRGYAYLFITHDLAVVRYIADRVLVMYLGEIVEELGPEHLISDPLHPYTQMLSQAIPGRGDRERTVIRGEIPSPLAVPKGCRFHSRCPFAMPICSAQAPPMIRRDGNRAVRCHLYADSAAQRPSPEENPNRHSPIRPGKE